LYNKENRKNKNFVGKTKHYGREEFRNERNEREEVREK
jgi:hypothetical protein